MDESESRAENQAYEVNLFFKKKKKKRSMHKWVLGVWINSLMVFKFPSGLPEAYFVRKSITSQKVFLSFWDQI